MEYFSYICSVKWINYIWFAVLLLVLPSCDSLTRDGARMQKTLHEQQRRAESLLSHVIEALDTHNFDSLVHYTHTEDDIMLYVYRGQQLVYWTGSWLSSLRYPLRNVYDVWQFAYWDNAWGVCKRVRAGDVHILAVIPIKYNYQVRCTNMHNLVIIPFKSD